MLKKFILTLFAISSLFGKTFSQCDTTYRVALMMPLYLEQVDEVTYRQSSSSKTMLQKPFSYIQFYEGFIMAVDSISTSKGVCIDLNVYDITTDTASVNDALNDTWLANADLIVGPFHVKPFEQLSKFAVAHNIPIVNPVTNRSSLINDMPTAIKTKPSEEAQMESLRQLLAKNYADAKVFVVNMYEEPTTDIYKIEDIAKSVTGSEVVHVNMLQHEEHYILRDEFSNEMENVVIVYADDKALAAEAVNVINRYTDEFDVTLITLPKWGRYDGLFDDYLVKMKTVFFDDIFIDYNDLDVQHFVCDFRSRYVTEPTDYAFIGFDTGWYFLNALKQFGREFPYNLGGFESRTLSTKYRFTTDYFNGQENTYWNIYQYINYEKVLIPID